MPMIHTRKSALAVLLLFCMAATPVARKRVVFFDDFSGKALDRSKWNVEVSGIHVNDELQGYVDSSATIYLENNALVLRPLYSPGFVSKDGQHFDFVSGRINTKGKFDFKYGTAEARIRLSEGQGLWPAWWMLGNGEWPATGEVDIMEYVGEKDWASAAVHGPGYSGGKGPVAKAYFEKGNGVTQWHIYAVDWTPDSLIFKYDGRKMFGISKTFIAPKGKWAFDNNKYLILNFAVGGVYPAKVNGIKEPYYGLSASTLGKIRRREARMWVDLVKVTQD
ncbi:MAG: glycoside hydrolase family 16 protein [Bacteroidetes bacterium]|nr:glycoside hydrolase family 16 protein [Bacteroidota bacterium]